MSFLRWLPVTASVTLMLMIASTARISFSQLKESTDWRRHSYDVLSSAQNFLATIFDATRGMRAYVLTGDPSSQEKTRAQIERFLGLITKTQIITPTPDETAMHTAASASVKSACLSRQVGAAITDSKGNLLGVGWNDVPKYKGGLYEELDLSIPQDDQRCSKLGGYCRNDKEKAKIVDETVSELVKEGVIPEALAERAKEVIKKSKVKDLIEFSRAVHAEMHAIINAAQETGIRMRGGNIYCTTYPCHACARHIIAAGIRKVYFVEPYRKSLAISLHGDAITEGEDSDKVRLIRYHGIAPRRYSELFECIPNSRKDTFGKLKLQNRREVKNPAEISLESFPVLEGLILAQLQEAGLLSAS